MIATVQASNPSNTALWAARVIGALGVLFLAFDAVGKFFRPQAVVDAFARLGLSIDVAPLIGSILLALVILYVIRRTRRLSAILLTGYLGGAVAVQLRAGSSLFETLFAVAIGVLVWAPLYLTDERVRAVFAIE
ncbi:MAG TPA: DoxX family protein [Candidatus Baltobacteraceae bacterium]|nr:DoxX family protein [Candidatus Baltobacteraceae bacterium]